MAHCASRTLVNNVGFRARRYTPHDRRVPEVVRYVLACMQLSVEPTIATCCAGVGVLCPVPQNLRVVSLRAEPARCNLSAREPSLTNRLPSTLRA